MKADTRVLLAWAGCFAAFVALALYTATRDSPGMDLNGIRAVQHAPAPLGDVFDAVTFLGAGVPLSLITVVAALAFLARGRIPEAGLLALTWIPRVLVDPIKGLVEAPRPAPDLVQVRGVYEGYAFPSGHVVATTAVFVLLFIFADRLRLPAPATIAVRGVSVLMVGTVGLARVWQGAHWPSDVAGGYLFAAGWLFAMLWLQAALTRRAESASAST